MVTFFKIGIIVGLVGGTILMFIHFKLRKKIKES